VYRHEVGSSPNVDTARDLVAAFAAAEGRQPRILVAKMGQDGHDRGQKVIATAFADSASTSTSARCSRRRRGGPAGVEADVHIVGVNSLAAGHLTLVPALRAETGRTGPVGHHDRGRRA